MNNFEKKNVTLSVSANRLPDLEDKVKELSHQNNELQTQVRGSWRNIKPRPKARPRFRETIRMRTIASWRWRPS